MKQAASNQRLADRLLLEGHITAERHATVMAWVALHGGRVEDALIENEAIGEADLLRYVATVQSTRFVSTEKLYKALIDPKILQLVPRKLADQYSVLPVMYDDARRALSIVTADPDDLAMLNDVQIASGVREVVALVGRPGAIRAAIGRAYYNDVSGFAQLLRAENKITLSVDRFQSGVAATTNPFAAQLAHPPAQPAAVAAPTVVHGTISEQLYGQESPAPAREPAPPPPPPVTAPARPPPPPPPAAPVAQVQQRTESRPPSRPLRTSEPVPAFTTLSADYIETLNVFVSLLETSRPDLRGHSAQCARLVRSVCERMGLPAQQTAAYAVAGHLHDVGKAGTYHLTALNVAEYDGHRSAVQKIYNVPERFFQGVTLHADTKSAVNAMYERFDGKGLPLGVGGKEIPLGARILAVIDTFCDLTSNPRNPARKTLKAADAMTFLAKHRGAIFDPTVLDLVKAEVAGDDLRAKLLSDRHTVLLVDPDPEDLTVLELRLLEAGFDVRTARTYQQALHELKTHEITVVISDVDLDATDAGIALRSAAVGEPWGKKVIAWIIHTRKTDRQVAEIVFELGVDDLVSKPTPSEVFVTKVRQLVDRKRKQTAAGRGVSGSLNEMGLPDVVQILWHGRKSCTVRLTTKSGAGDIAFVDGQIVDARFGSKRGEDAFYHLLTLKDGDFKIDADVQSTERTIDQSPEGLLLEGMRRMDEGLL